MTVGLRALIVAAFARIRIDMDLVKTPALSVVSRPAWIWPLRLPPEPAGRFLVFLRRLGDGLGRWPAWLLAGALAGALPLLLTISPGLSRCVTVLLLTPLLLAAAAKDWFGRGLLLLAVVFLAHNATAIALFLHDPACLTERFPDAATYWVETRSWLVTGSSREYELSWWLPAHVQLLGGVVLFAYTSLGVVPFWEGFYQVDLMNGYVSQLVLHSQNPWTALGLGWHPWSICRGIGFCIITLEMCSISLGRLTGARLSTCARRRARWLAGLGFLLLDAALKYILLEPVRTVLAANLL
jgi:hypothetical protein